MTVHWIRGRLHASEYARIKDALANADAASQLRGGHHPVRTPLEHPMLVYELIRDNQVVDTTSAASLKDAAYQFYRRAPLAKNNDKIPAAIVSSVKTAIENNVGCDCVAATCATAKCVVESVEHGMKYIDAYSMTRARPSSMTMTIRTPSRHDHHIAVTTRLLTQPTLEDVRHMRTGKLTFSLAP